MSKLRKNINRILSMDLMLKNNFKSNTKTALIIRDDGIGDFLLFSGFIPLYRDYFKQNGIKTLFLVKKQYMSLANIYLSKDRIIGIDDKLYYDSLSYRRKLLNRLLAISPDYIISSIYRSSQGDDIVRMLKNKRRISVGYEGEILIKNKRKYFYDIIIKSYDSLHSPSSMRYNHVINHENSFFLSLIKELDLPKKFGEYSLLECMPAIPKIEGGKIPDKNYFSCVAGAGSRKRIYPADKLTKVLIFIFEHTKLNCAMLGGKKETELSDAILSEMPFKYRKRVLDCTGKSSLMESLALLKNGKFTIGSETGMVHASWIMNVPTIILYGGGHFGRFLPLTKEGKIVYKKMPCYRCNWQCKFNEEPVRCISGIEERKIYDRITGIINEYL